MTDTTTLAQVRALLADCLGLGARAQDFQTDTPLLGHVPELDSTAVVDLLTGIEERFGLTINDDDIDATLFDSVGSLVAYIDGKLGR